MGPNHSSAALGIDLDGTIDEAPEFFRLLSSVWPAAVYIITYRDHLAKAQEDVTRFGIKAQVILVNSFAEKATKIRELGIKVFFDDMDEVLLHIPSDVTVFKVRNEGNFDFKSRKWLYSKVTGRPIA